MQIQNIHNPKSDNTIKLSLTLHNRSIEDMCESQNIIVIDDVP